jgi:hypothetical protein
LLDPTRGLLAWPHTEEDLDPLFSPWHILRVGGRSGAV